VDITVVGPVVAADGLGRNTIDFFDVLRTKYKVNLLWTHLDRAHLPDWIKEFVKKKPKLIGKLILYTKPVWNLSAKDISFLDLIKESKDKVKIAYSMFESSLLPPMGVECLNKYFDLIVVPDEYLIDVYKNSGITKPIKVLPLGLNFSELAKFPIKRKKNENFVFTILSSAIYRKNILGTVHAFAKVFKNNPHVQLRINSRYSINGSNHEILRFIMNEGLQNVTFTTKALSEPEYNQLLSSSDCLVNLSMGEGFSIQPREAMVTGIPVIVSNNTAQKTICNTQLVKAVNSTIEEPAFHYFADAPYGNFFKCNQSDIEEAFLDVYHNYDKYLRNAEKAREWALQYDLKNLKDSYLDFFDPRNFIK
jgi:glycosyltransferase involved in cell wall biosynthesis